VIDVRSGDPHDTTLLATVEVQGNLARLPVKECLVDQLFEIVGHNSRKVGRRLLEHEGSRSFEQPAARLGLTVLS
jgi:hypothetical protein